MRDLSHREMKSVAISSRTMDLSEAGRATACLRDETVDAVVSSAVLQPIPDPPAALAADVPARVSSTVDWRSSSRTTEGLASGASVAGSGRGLEVSGRNQLGGDEFAHVSECPTHVVRLLPV